MGCTCDVVMMPDVDVRTNPSYLLKFNLRQVKGSRCYLFVNSTVNGDGKKIFRPFGGTRRRARRGRARGSHLFLPRIREMPQSADSILHRGRDKRAVRRVQLHLRMRLIRNHIDWQPSWAKSRVDSKS